jgi:hypothetical protein
MLMFTTDGTDTGTHFIMYDANYGPRSTFTTGKELFFTGDPEGKTQFRIWTSDGTVSGTKPVDDTLFFENFYGFQATGQKLFYAAARESYQNHGNLYSIDLKNPISAIKPSAQHAPKSLLFPNPANDYISITNSTNYNSFRILNSIGQVVKSGILSDSKINVTDLPEGLYFMEAINGPDKSVLKLMIAR